MDLANVTSTASASDLKIIRAKTGDMITHVLRIDFFNRKLYRHDPADVRRYYTVPGSPELEDLPEIAEDLDGCGLLLGNTLYVL